MDSRKEDLKNIMDHISKGMRAKGPERWNQHSINLLNEIIKPLIRIVQEQEFFYEELAKDIICLESDIKMLLKVHNFES